MLINAKIRGSAMLCNAIVVQCTIIFCTVADSLFSGNCIVNIFNAKSNLLMEINANLRGIAMLCNEIAVQRTIIFCTVADSRFSG